LYGARHREVPLSETSGLRVRANQGKVNAGR